MQTNERSDEECLQRAQAGDRTAFSVVVRRHQRSIFRYIVRMIGSPDESLELTQDAFVRAWEALPGWTPSATVRTWLFSIASHLALDLLRRRRTVEFVPLADEHDAVGPGVDPERQAQLTQEVRQLEAALGRLAPEHREVLLLREVENMSYEEIGRALSLSEGTVKSRLARARAALLEQAGRSAE